MVMAWTIDTTPRPIVQRSSGVHLKSADRQHHRGRGPWAVELSGLGLRLPSC